VEVREQKRLNICGVQRDAWQDGGSNKCSSRSTGAAEPVIAFRVRRTSKAPADGRCGETTQSSRHRNEDTHSPSLSQHASSRMESVVA
jgi:hypothetical protein